jgi:hypothetical protein
MHAQWPATRPPFAVGGEEEMDLDSEMEDMQQQRVFFLFLLFLYFFLFCCILYYYLLFIISMYYVWPHQSKMDIARTSLR